MDKESTISVFVRQMRVNVRIGLYEAERAAPQPLDVSVELFAAPVYLNGADKGGIINYERIHGAIKAWESRDHVELIEDYLRELLEIGFEFDQVIAVRASVSKPEIFAESAAAGLSVFMRRADYKTTA